LSNVGHCQITIQLENGFLVETDLIISPSIKEPMLEIDWLARNATRWNFLEGTIIIQNPAFNLGPPSSSHASFGRELAVKSVGRDDRAKPTTSRVVLHQSPVLFQMKYCSMLLIKFAMLPKKTL